MTPYGCEACYRCRECDRRTCAEVWPSPREDEGICSDCAEACGPAEAAL